MICDGLWSLIYQTLGVNKINTSLIKIKIYLIMKNSMHGIMFVKNLRRIK